MREVLANKYVTIEPAVGSAFLGGAISAYGATRDNLLQAKGAEGQCSTPCCGPCQRLPSLFMFVTAVLTVPHMTTCFKQKVLRGSAAEQAAANNTSCHHCPLHLCHNNASPHACILHSAQHRAAQQLQTHQHMLHVCLQTVCSTVVVTCFLPSLSHAVMANLWPCTASCCRIRCHSPRAFAFRQLQCPWRFAVRISIPQQCQYPSSGAEPSRNPVSSPAAPSGHKRCFLPCHPAVFATASGRCVCQRNCNPCCCRHCGRS